MDNVGFDDIITLEEDMIRVESDMMDSETDKNNNSNTDRKHLVIDQIMDDVFESNDKSYYDFIIKVMPFITTKNLTDMCIDMLKMTETRCNVIKFLTYAFQSNLLNSSSFDAFDVDTDDQEMLKLISVATNRIIDLDSCSDKKKLDDDIDVHVFNLMTDSSRDVAEKLTYMCSEYYIKIKIQDLVSYVRLTDSKVIDKNISKLVEIFETFSKWIPTLIIRNTDRLKQEKIVKKFVKIAMHCRKLRNYHMTMAIYAGLNSTPITRLTYLWKDQKYNASIKIIGDLMSPFSNYLTYRNELENGITSNIDSNIVETKLERANEIVNTKSSKSISKACVPYIGVLLSDVQHMLEVELIDIENRCLVKKPIETIVIMMNRFIRTQVPYNRKLSHPEIHIDFGKFVIWNDKDLFEVSKLLVDEIAEPNKIQRLTKSVSDGAKRLSMKRRKSNADKNINLMGDSTSTDDELIKQTTDQKTRVTNTRVANTRVTNTRVTNTRVLSRKSSLRRLTRSMPNIDSTM